MPNIEYSESLAQALGSGVRLAAKLKASLTTGTIHILYVTQ